MSGTAAGGNIAEVPAGVSRAEIRVPATGAAWLADVDAIEDGGIMSLRLQPAILGIMPTWSEGMAVDCTIDAGRHSYYARTTVIRQRGQHVCLRVPGGWLHTDRRASPRRMGGFAVSYRSEERDGTAACIDISEGGMCLELREAVALQDALHLLFVLPGDADYTEAEATVVWAGPSGGQGRVRIGVAFRHISPGGLQRIADYCRSAVGA